MMQLNPMQARKFVESSLMSRTPVIVWGAPGIGKSAVMEQIAQDLGAVLIDIRLSQWDSVDVRGIPSIDREHGLTLWNPPSTLPFKGNPAFDNEAMRDQLIILFLDELLQAIPTVQAVAFQLVLDRRVGEHELLPNVRVVAASNRETDKAGINRMLTPLANRFVHIEMVPHLDSWCDWAWAHDIEPRIVAALRFRPDLLTTFDPTKNEKVFASPRTWEYLNRFMRQAQHLTQDILIAAAYGTVGQGPATELLAFLDVWESMPNIENILKNPTTAPLPEKSKPAVAFAVTSALAARATKDNFAHVYDYAKRLPPEYTVRCIKDATKRNTELRTHKVFIQFCTEYQELNK